jgi:hypothetical protein
MIPSASAGAGVPTLGAPAFLFKYAVSVRGSL